MPKAAQKRQSVAIILVFNSKGEVLVTKRAKTKRFNPGLYEIGQGGRLEKGESFHGAAVRELREELGISGVELRYLLDFSFSAQLGLFRAKAYSCGYEGKMRLQKSEIESGFFISLEKLREMVETRPGEFTPDSPEFIKALLAHL